MRIKHGDAVVLEAIVRGVFNCERGGMGYFCRLALNRQRTNAQDEYFQRP